MTVAIPSETMLNTQEIQLLLFPGLGGDHRMVRPQLMLPFRVRSHDLIEMFETETQPEYAARFLSQLRREGMIDFDRPLIIGGYSFGGAVALEMSRLTKCSGVLLIGGLASGSEYRAVVRYVGLHAAKHVPDAVFAAATPLLRLFLRLYTKLSKSDIDLCISMYRNFSRRLFRNAFFASARWKGCDTNVPVFRVHGTDDQIIRPPAPAPNVKLVPTAKHLVSLSHAKIVNAAIEEFVDRSMRSATSP